MAILDNNKLYENGQHLMDIRYEGRLHTVNKILVQGSFPAFEMLDESG